MFAFLDWNSPTTQVVVWCAVLAALLAVGIYVIGLVRGSLHNRDASTHEILANFRDLHGEGGLDDEEYRTIKAMLSERLQREIKDSGEEG